MGSKDRAEKILEDEVIEQFTSDFKIVARFLRQRE